MSSVSLSILAMTFVLRHRNETTEAEARASAGREPCVLIEGDDGNLSMIVDWNDLQAADGSVETFEKTFALQALDVLSPFSRPSLSGALE